MSQTELFPESEVYDAAYENPMVVTLGKGPAGEKCKTCIHMFKKTQYKNPKHYWKCKLRGDTNGEQGPINE